MTALKISPARKACEMLTARMPMTTLIAQSLSRRVFPSPHVCLAMLQHHFGNRHTTRVNIDRPTSTGRSPRWGWSTVAMSCPFSKTMFPPRSNLVSRLLSIIVLTCYPCRFLAGSPISILAAVYSCILLERGKFHSAYVVDARFNNCFL